MKNGAVSYSSLAYVLTANAIILFLMGEIFQDYASRLAYWRSMDFTPSTTYYPFFFITTAVRGSTYIAGQLTLDWTQVLAVILVVIDVWFVVGILRSRKRVQPDHPTSSAQAGSG